MKQSFVEVSGTRTRIAEWRKHRTRHCQWSQDIITTAVKHPARICRFYGLLKKIKKCILN